MRDYFVTVTKQRMNYTLNFSHFSSLDLVSLAPSLLISICFIFGVIFIHFLKSRLFLFRPQWCHDNGLRRRCQIVSDLSNFSSYYIKNRMSLQIYHQILLNGSAFFFLLISFHFSIITNNHHLQLTWILVLKRCVGETK